jgi:hypothetical protein
VIYYKYFKIDIINYLEFTEILTLFLDNLIAIVGIIVLLIMYITIIADKDPESALKKKFPKLYWALPIIFSVCVACFVWFFMKDVLFQIISIIVVLLIFGTIFFKGNEQYKKHFGKEFNIETILFFILFVLMVISLSLTLPHQIKEKKLSAKYLMTKITLIDGEIIRTDSNKYVVGNTKNFLFIHDDKHNHNKIIPMLRVKMIEEGDYFIVSQARRTHVRSHSYKDILSYDTFYNDTLLIFGDEHMIINHPDTFYVFKNDTTRVEPHLWGDTLYVYSKDSTYIKRTK